MNEQLAIADAEQTLTWAIAVTTAPRSVGGDRRYEELAQQPNWRRGPSIEWTLESLKNGGFDVDFVFAEPGSYKPAAIGWKQWIDRPSPFGAWRNWKEALRQLLEAKPQANVIMIVQDDVIVCKNSRQFLDRILWPDNCGCLSLYCSARYACGKGLFVVRANHTYWGACTFAFKRETALNIVNDSRILKAFRPDGNRIDSRIGHFCNRTRQHLYSFSPSLAQHIGEFRSSIGHGGGGGYRAADFLGESFDAMTLPIHNTPKIKRAVAVALPVFGCGEQAAKAIGALAHHCSENDLTLWLVDNGGPADDFKTARLAADLSGLAHEIVTNEINRGFTYAINQVISANPNSHILILNSDAYVQSDVVKLGLKHFENNSRIGAIGPLEFNLDRVGPYNDIRKRSELNRFSRRLPDDVERVARELEAMPMHFVPRNVLAYFCTLLRREAIDQVGMLDERLVSGLGADNLHCDLLIRGGWLVGLAYNAIAIHEGSASFRAANLPKASIQHRDVKLYHHIKRELNL